MSLYLYILYRDWDVTESLLIKILAIFKFLIKKRFLSEACAIYEGIREEKSILKYYIYIYFMCYIIDVPQEYKNKMKKVGKLLIKKTGQNNLYATRLFCNELS